MTWKQVMERDDIVGGCLEVCDGGDVYRGPVSSIKLEEGVVRIDLSWMAKLVREHWVNYPNIPCYQALRYTATLRYR
jgi:hypothetical protein